MIKFNNEKEFQTFLDKKFLVFKGSGSEGEFYFSRADKLGYKIFYNHIDHKILEEDINKIIMDSEVQLESFLFPIDSLVVDGKLAGYISKYKRNNILSDENIFEIDVLNFDFDSLKQAYKLMKIDVSLLTDKGILIYDLPNNLVYDGKRLYAIDTYSYLRSNDKGLLKQNIDSLDNAIDTIIYSLYNVQGYDIELRKQMGISVIEYINYLKREMNKYKKQYKLNDIR